MTESGRCNREAIATVLGGVTGAVIGSRTSTSDNRTVATIIGAAAGALIGKWIGRQLDEADRSCVGHALEVGKSGQRVIWTNDSTGVRYEIVPGVDRERNGAAGKVNADDLRRAAQTLRSGSTVPEKAQSLAAPSAFQR